MPFKGRPGKRGRQWREVTTLSRRDKARRMRRLACGASSKPAAVRRQRNFRKIRRGSQQHSKVFGRVDANPKARHLRGRSRCVELDRYPALTQIPRIQFVGPETEFRKRLLVHQRSGLAFIRSVQDGHTVPNQNSFLRKGAGRPNLTARFHVFHPLQMISHV